MSKNKKPMFTVEDLRKSGHLVMVLHYRDMYPFYYQEYDTGKRESIMTRLEFEGADADGSLFSYACHGAVKAKYSNAVRPKGGFTIVKVTTPEGETFTGKFNFSKNRQFNKKIGVAAALGRAMYSKTPVGV